MPMIRKFALAGMVALGLAAGTAGARPVADCPLRDAPFSVDSPLIDVLLSPAAKALVERQAGRSIDKAPPRFVGTTPPTFAAILTVRKAGTFTGMKDADAPALDAALRALPVTAADKLARCARYDNAAPVFRLAPGRKHLLLFEKIVGFKDEPSVKAAHKAFTEMAARKGWDIVSTESAGAITPATLRRFDAVIWNNISGDVLSLSQRKALRGWLAAGGSFVAVHGSAGDPAYFWDWYADNLLGARFLAHPMNPQFQEARIAVNRDHPLAKGLPAEWKMTDEWYSFTTNPRKIGAQVVLTLDESTYSPVGPMGADLKMGDHPLAWSNCIGKGKMFYSAIGHRPETYSQPEYVTLLENALTWATSPAQPCKARRAGAE